jgi:aldehyde dehydrogenase (NAD+)/gamma-glutamyl-gamma-aminobutyraldehyde dehydrogenase
LAALIRENTAELAVLENLNSGKTKTDCLHEIGNEVADHVQWYAERADETFGKVAPTGEKAMALVVKEPSGVVGLILPWNFPLLMAAWKLASALDAGCSCIVKKAKHPPLAALKLAHLAQESGGPDGCPVALWQSTDFQRVISKLHSAATNVQGRCSATMEPKH